MRFSLPSSISQSSFGIAYFDFFWLLVSPFFALWLRGDNLIDVNHKFIISSAVCEYVFITFICGLPTFIFFRINGGLIHLCTSKDIFAVFFAVFVSVLLSSYVVFSFSRLDGIPRSLPLLYGFVLFLGLVGYRVAVRSVYEKKISYDNPLSYLNASIALKKVLIIGIDKFSISAIKLTDNQKPRTIQIIAVISPDSRYSGKTITGIKIIGQPLDFGMTIDEYDVHGVKIDEVWFSSYNNISADFMSILEDACKERSIKFKSLEEALNLTPTSIPEFSLIDNLKSQIISINHTSYMRIKRLLDILSSIILCLVLFPVFISICIITLYEIGSPILFWQERVGLYGRKFLLYKIRTLGLPFGTQGQILPDVERVSKLGLLIRRFRLDEIPQLLSILVGDMSFIGPRPLLPRDQPRESFERLIVRPGLTGWAQIHGGELLTIEEKNALDCWYVNNISFKLDVSIVCKTIPILFYGVRRNENEVNRALNWYKNRLGSSC